MTATTNATTNAMTPNATTNATTPNATTTTTTTAPNAMGAVTGTASTTGAAIDTENFTEMSSLMPAFAKAMNLVNPAIEHHHEQTAYMALFIARAAGLPQEDVILSMQSALLHDIGTVVIETTPSLEEIERNARALSLVGARMIADLPRFGELANIISYSQCSWRETVARAIEEGAVCERLGRIASIVRLADAVSTILRPDESVLNQVGEICENAKTLAGIEFCPDAVDALVSLSGTEYVWMDLAHNPMFLTYFIGENRPVSLDETVLLTGFVSRIIDYRSPFTAMHSAGVAAVARQMALLAGMNDAEVLQMQIAGNLHDIGKLAIPRKILEKPGKLTNTEYNVIKEHPYYTALILLGVEGFETIYRWASLHHEKLNGKGYPFHFGADDLGTGERIMAVADIFSAISEPRPYREGMSREQVGSVLMDDVRAGAICNDVVALLMENYELIEGERDRVSRLAGKRYFDSLGRNAAQSS